MLNHMPWLHKLGRTRLSKRILRTWNAWRRCGWRTGGQFLKELKCLSNVAVPGSQISVTLRPGTSDCKVFEHIFLTEAYKMDFSPLSVRRIVDCGANIGLASVYFAMNYQDARIIAVEPEPGNYELLKRNISLHKGVKPIHAAVWPVNEKVAISNPGAAGWSFRVHADGGAAANDSGLQGLTIPDIMLEGGFDAIDLLKIDIEGSEKKLFQSDCSWIKSVAVIVIELHDWIVPGCSAAVYPVMDRMGFCCLHAGENAVFINRQRIGLHN